MSSVDDRIVSMQFDNAAFERKLAGTIQSLDRLRESLNFDASKKGMEDLSKSTSKFNVDPMTGAIEGVSKSFVAMSTIAIAALASITAKALDAGIAITKAMSLDPVIDGFKEYEINMNSIQTILANTRKDGTNLQDVNAALDDLNLYSDQTIYNFAQMTRNIGAATAAGVDLDTAVTYVKGFANSAAVAGVGAEGMAGALEQMSQALAAGTIRAQDWISLERRGLAGQVQQEAFFNMAKAMGTMNDVPIDQTFEEWTSAGNTLRGSLQEGWLTADVFLNTMGAFAGEMDEAKLSALGFTDEMIPAMLELGQVGIESATKIRTFTQLVDVVKESIASGWSQTFRIILGDFTEATDLFSSLGNTISGVVDGISDSRNDLLQGWKDLGGRTLLLEALTDAFKLLARVFAPIKEAFREIFPATTAEDLYELTETFSNFVDQFRFGGAVVDKIRRSFSGFFAVISIGWEIVKQAAVFIWDFFSAFTSANAGGVLDTTATIGDFLTNIQQMLVEGGAISRFFNNLRDSISSPLGALEGLKDLFSDLFDGSGIEGGNAILSFFDALVNSLGFLGTIFNGLRSVFGWFADIFSDIVEALEPVGEYISEWFSTLGEKLSESVENADFDQVFSAINTGLLAGIGAILVNFFRNGLPIDFGGGLLESITDAFGELTGVLASMQTEIRAKSIMKIAIAIAILTAAVLVMSLINPSSLTAALIAVGAGLTQLGGVIAVLDRLSIGTSGIKMLFLAVSMIAVASAMLLLSFAIAKLSSLDLGELAKGLAGVGIAMGLMVLAVNSISGSSGGMIRAGTSMILMAIAMRIMAEAVEAFAEMDWGTMARGLVGVAVALGLVVAASNLMPSGMLAQGLGIVAIAVGLRILGEAVEKFSTLNWSEMGRGFAGVAAGLAIIAAAMHLMPPNMLLTSAALIVVASALRILVEAVEAMGNLSLEELLYGVGGLAAALLAIALATNLMTGAIGGAVAIAVVAGALLILTEVIATLGNLSISSIVTGIAAIAAVIVILGLAALLLTPVIPALLQLGVALTLLGVAFALFGVGASLVATAFEILAHAGVSGMEAIVVSLEILGEALPRIIRQILVAIGEALIGIIEMMPLFIKVLETFILQFLDTVIALVPKLAETVGTIIVAALDLARTYIPEFALLGTDIIIGFLSGIRDRIGEIVTVVADIIINFFDALSLKTPEVVDSIWNFLTVVFDSVMEKLTTVVDLIYPKGQEIIGGLLDGITSLFGDIISLFTSIPSKIITAIGDVVGLLVDKGEDLIKGLLNGIETIFSRVISFYTELPVTILSAIGDVATTLWNTGITLMQGLWNGLLSIWSTLSGWIRGLPGMVLSIIGDVSRTLYGKGLSILQGLKSGIEDRWDRLYDWLSGMPGRLLSALGNIGDSLYEVGKDIFEGLKRGMSEVWESTKDWLSGLNPANWKGPPKRDAVMLLESGMLIFQGLLNGMKTGWDENTKWLRSIDPSDEIDTDKITKTLQDTFDSIVAASLSDMEPTIRPILDLSDVERQAASLNGLLGVTAIAPSLSTDQANLISHTTEDKPETPQVEDPFAEAREIKFEQNIYSPTSLSTNDIYRNTRSQIATAKEELNIP